jgi:hypothetical protein
VYQDPARNVLSSLTVPRIQGRKAVFFEAAILLDAA